MLHLGRLITGTHPGRARGVERAGNHAGREEGEMMIDPITGRICRGAAEYRADADRTRRAIGAYNLAVALAYQRFRAERMESVKYAFHDWEGAIRRLDQSRRAAEREIFSVTGA